MFKQMFVFFLLTVSSMSFADFDEKRLEVAREVMLYNQDNWEEALLNYTDDVVYEDAIMNNDENNRYKIIGISKLTRFMKNLFNFTVQDLVIEEEVYMDDTYMSTWKLSMYAKPLTKEIVVSGSTILKFRDNKVYYHRDFYSDSVIWEKIPFIGMGVKRLRKLHRGNAK